MSADNDLPSNDARHLRYLKRVFTALRLLSQDPACQLQLTYAIDAALVAVHVAAEGGDVRLLCEKSTAWCVDEAEAELIERVAEQLRQTIAPPHTAENRMN